MECKLINIAFNTSEANCKCQEPPENNDLLFDQIKDNLLSTLLNSNFEVVCCYNLVFDINILVTNIGSWFFISIGVVIIFNFVLSMIKSTTPLLNYLNNLHQQLLKNKLISSKQQNYCKIQKYTKTNDKDSNEIFTFSTRKLKQNNKMNSIKHYDSEDFNEMEFEDLIQYDKRSFMKLYFDSIKIFHIFLNACFVHNRKILKHIKIAKLLNSIMLDFSLSAFFYSDKYISNNYQNERESNFIYNLPISIYTYLFGTAISIGLNILSDSESGISKIAKNEHLEEMLKEIKTFLNMYKYKFIFFYLLQGILLLFFWYYVAAFCAVYQNSQYNWLISCATSTGMSMCIPFGIALIYSIIRAISLKYKSKWFYKILSFVFWFV